MSKTIYKILLFMGIAVLCSFLFINPQVYANPNPNEIVNKLSSICPAIDKDLDAQTLKLAIDNKTDKYAIENWLQSTRQKCIDKEVGNFVKGIQTKEDYSKAKAFLEIISPLQSDEFVNKNFNSIWLSMIPFGIIQQFSRFVQADNWICLPHIVNNILIDEIVRVLPEYNCSTTPLISLDDAIDKIRGTALILSPLICIYMVVIGYQKKDKLNYIISNILKYLFKLSVIIILPIVFTFLIFGLNVSNHIILTIFNSTSSICPPSEGMQCVTKVVFESTQKLDFVKLKSTNLVEVTKDVSIFDYVTNSANNLGRIDWVAGIWYLALYSILGGIFLYYTCIFAGRQIKTWIEIVVHYLAAYLCLIKVDVSIIKVISQTKAPIYESIKYTLYFTFFIYFMSLLMSIPVVGGPVVILVVMFLNRDSLFSLLSRLLNLKSDIPKEAPNSSYYGMAKGLFNTGKQTKATIENKVGQLANKKEQAVNLITKSKSLGLQSFNFLKNKFKKK